MAKGNQKIEEEEKNTAGEGEGESEGENEEKTSSKKDEVAVLDSAGQKVRVYSKKEQGENFKSLAKEYAGKIGGSVK